MIHSLLKTNFVVLLLLYIWESLVFFIIVKQTMFFNTDYIMGSRAHKFRSYILVKQSQTKVYVKLQIK